MASAGATARQAQQASAGGISGSPNLASASQAAREAVNDFQDAYFKERKFDPYLQFASAEDERKFRERESERQEAIQKAMALNTPEGDLKAAQLSKAQLLDAGAHGAARSPDYEPLLAKTTAAATDLKAAISDRTQEAASAQRLESAVAAPSSNSAPDIPPDVLAALRRVQTPDQDQGGHGLGQSATATTDRVAPGRG